MLQTVVRGSGRVCGLFQACRNYALALCPPVYSIISSLPGSRSPLGNIPLGNTCGTTSGTIPRWPISHCHIRSLAISEWLSSAGGREYSLRQQSAPHCFLAQLHVGCQAGKVNREPDSRWMRAHLGCGFCGCGWQQGGLTLSAAHTDFKEHGGKHNWESLTRLWPQGPSTAGAIMHQASTRRSKIPPPFIGLGPRVLQVALCGKPHPGGHFTGGF